jgi:acyl-CoA reductase-like NAD-dependent aldehyde dehydrogenase
VTAPMMLVHALLAESPIVIKTSGVDPFTPYLFVKALVREGIKTPQLLHLESGTQHGPAQIGRLIQNTGQSMVFGEDATLDKVYDSLPAGHHNHKKIPFWTGRSGTIVLDDADLPFAAQCVIESAIWNSGRSCVNTKKVFCSSQIAGELEALIVAEADKLRRRPYDDYYCDVGPQRAEFKDHVLGHVPVTDLIYERDLLIARCQERSSLLHEEYPYPVIALVSGPSDELVRMANGSVRDTPSHLSMNMAVFTRDRERFDRCVDDLLAYKVTWNGTTNPFWVFDAHQGMFFFQEMMRVKAVSFGRPSLFERGAPLKRPWPW